MRHKIAILLLSGPITAFAATNTIALEIGKGHAADVRCPAGATCSDSDASWRFYYGFQPGESFGFRITHTDLDHVRLTTEADEIFNDPGISSTIRDLSATYTYSLSKLFSITAKAGIAQWEEHRSRGGSLDADSSNGLSPACGFNVDFGNKWLRAGLSADIYPSVGDAGHVRYYGAGLRFVW